MMITGWAVLSFRRTHTTVNLMEPSVVGDVRDLSLDAHPDVSRHVVILVGCALCLADVVVVLFLHAFILYMNRFQLESEECALTAPFGQRVP